MGYVSILSILQKVSTRFTCKLFLSSLELLLVELGTKGYILGSFLVPDRAKISSKVIFSLPRVSIGFT